MNVTKKGNAKSRQRWGLGCRMSFMLAVASLAAWKCKSEAKGGKKEEHRAVIL